VPGQEKGQENHEPPHDRKSEGHSKEIRIPAYLKGISCGKLDNLLIGKKSSISKYFIDIFLFQVGVRIDERVKFSPGTFF